LRGIELVGNCLRLVNNGPDTYLLLGRWRDLVLFPVVLKIPALREHSALMASAAACEVVKSDARIR
jgi:hypothetical protein